MLRHALRMSLPSSPQVVSILTPSEAAEKLQLVEHVLRYSTQRYGPWAYCRLRPVHSIASPGAASEMLSAQCVGGSPLLGTRFLRPKVPLGT